MDELVLRGMAKWPNVPAVYGWLELDRRGNWLIKGAKIGNDALVRFIGRNYQHDRGYWFFQNGPQRVFVDLHYTPQVYRAVNREHQSLELHTHTGKRVVRVNGAWLDDNGCLLISTEHGPGILHDADSQLILGAFRNLQGAPVAEAALEELMHAVQRGNESALCLQFDGHLTALRFLPSHQVPEYFGFCAHPSPPSINQ